MNQVNRFNKVYDSDEACPNYKSLLNQIKDNSNISDIREWSDSNTDQKTIGVDFTYNYVIVGHYTKDEEEHEVEGRGKINFELTCTKEVSTGECQLQLTDGQASFKDPQEIINRLSSDKNIN